MNLVAAGAPTRGLALVTAALLALAGAAQAQPSPLRIAAASDLQSALPVITGAFEEQTGIHVTTTFGSSGNFFAQIQNGAPFDVFLSADVDYPRQLENSGHAEHGSLYEYAVGRLVLWTRTDSGVDVRAGLRVLTDARIRRVAIANPDHAPYGRAAVAALRHENLYDRVSAKIVRGENISQAAQFAASGGADAGLLALSLALGPALKAAGAYVEVPEGFYPPIEQGAIVLSASGQKAAGRQFITFLMRPETGRMLQQYGFGVPAAKGR